MCTDIDAHRTTTSAALRLLDQAEQLVLQARALLACEDAPRTADDHPPLDPKTAARVAKVGEVAHLHLAHIEAHGSMTMADSRDIRRRLYGASIRSTANLFGARYSGALFYRPVPRGTMTLPSQEVRLTDEGERIAMLYRRLSAARPLQPASASSA